jgi:hypothetical protein
MLHIPQPGTRVFAGARGYLCHQPRHVHRAVCDLPISDQIGLVDLFFFVCVSLWSAGLLLRPACYADVYFSVRHISSIESHSLMLHLHILSLSLCLTVCSGTDIVAPHGVPVDLLDRLLIIRTMPYSQAVRASLSLSLCLSVCVCLFA